MKISVIVPVYNMEKTLRRALDSLVNQTYRDYEVILIDDGSRDSSGAICDEYAEKYEQFRVCHKQRNEGLSSARNRGMELACGEWVTFCDSDDYAFPDWLANYQLNDAEDYDLIQQGMRCDKNIFGQETKQDYCGFDYVGEPVKYIERLAGSVMTGYTFIKAYRLDMIRRHALAFNPDIRLQEDEVFFYQYMRYCRRVKSVGKQGYYYYAPDWERKYVRKPKEIIELYEALLPNLEAVVGKNCKTKFVRDYKDLFTDSLVSEFSHHPRMCYLDKIRELHLGDYDCSRLSGLLKRIVIKDRTHIFSWVYLLIHSTLREKIKKH